MNIVCIVALWLVSDSINTPSSQRHQTDHTNKTTGICILAASRLVFAVARDGVLPFSPWVAQIINGQPRNAVLVVWGVSAFITCTILPSPVAFTSLVSAAGVPSLAAYGLISLGRLFCTPKHFPTPTWSLGRLSKPFHVISVLWNGWAVAVLFSPYEFPVSASTLNYAPVIMGIVTIFALISWWVIPADRWLPSQRIQETLLAGERQAAENQAHVVAE